ncbi:copper chaperone PCu(A)C [Oceanospirillum sp.]|uniref:copper chaperone PCu(A)C n=1 Tax=Oceanospirillum sp. TaxID=2021254 RepID=UPI003A94883C
MKKWLTALVFALITPMAMAASTVDVKNPYARAVPPGQSNSAIFMMLENKSAKEVRLIRAQSSVADAVELHTHTMDQGVMKMRQVSEIAIPGNGMAHLKPGGHHIMLIGLKQNLFEGQKISVKLYFSNGSMSVVSMPVKKVMVGMNKHVH